MFEFIREYNFWDNGNIKIGYFRDSYIKKLSGYLNNSLVKVILGQRRVGKSYLLRMLIQSLIKNQGVSPKNILYINKDINELDFITTVRL